MLFWDLFVVCRDLFLYCVSPQFFEVKEVVDVWEHDVDESLCKIDGYPLVIILSGGGEGC